MNIESGNFRSSIVLTRIVDVSEVRTASAMMISLGRDFVTVAWWLPTIPGLAILLTVLAINLVGDRLRDALDPRAV